MLRCVSIAAVTVSCFLASSLTAGSVTLFSTGNPDGKIATLSRPGAVGAIETETADDFILGQAARVTNATFIGLVTGNAPTIGGVGIELYHVFPGDSTNPPSGQVPTRVNSPSDNSFAAFASADGSLTFTTTVLNPSFTAANSVVNGINPSPGQFTGGEGAVTGQEVEFDITFTTSFSVGATDHDFFRPEVGVTGGNFLWLSAPKPIVAPGTPFAPDLQSWIRNQNLSPDWLRIGTDITHQGPFNAAFSLSGVVTPEPSSLLLTGVGLCALLLQLLRRRAVRV